MQNGTVTPTTPAEIDKRVADVMQDIDKGIEDDFTEADENDPELLAELAQLTGPSRSVVNNTESDNKSAAVVLPDTLLNKIEILKGRIAMYESAEKAANEAGEAGRARRFNRGLQSINELLKRAMVGDDINIDDIPPEVSMKNVHSDHVEDGEEAVEDA